MTREKLVLANKIAKSLNELGYLKPNHFFRSVETILKVLETDEK